ncbi:MAG: M24 family metallopeptidase [Candidatus Thorarchaeota archaeon]
MDLTKQDLKDLALAGRISCLTLDAVANYVRPGTSIGTLHDTLVKLITKTPGARLAFPPNISVNECAAHDTAAPKESRVIPKRGLVKIDIGTNVNGMLSDTARTFSMDGKYGHLTAAPKIALKKAIEIIKPGVRVSEIGEVVQETIEGFGFKPIANLTGHQMKKGLLHAGLSIPSVKSFPLAKRSKLKVGTIVAIEPFATTGEAGLVEDAQSPALIYSVGNGNPKTPIGRRLTGQFQKLPFSLRSAYFSFQQEKIELEEITHSLSKDKFHGYKPLVERTGGLVSQAEHTILVMQEGAKVITR